MSEALATTKRTRIVGLGSFFYDDTPHGVFDCLCWYVCFTYLLIYLKGDL